MSTFLLQNLPGLQKYQFAESKLQLQPEMNLSHKSKKMHVVNKFRTWNGPSKFYIDLEANWLIILNQVRGKSPGNLHIFSSF